jgi:hypothetical protein
MEVVWLVDLNDEQTLISDRGVLDTQGVVVGDEHPP